MNTNAHANPAETLVRPTVHMNGTSRASLVEQRLDVYTAAKALLEAMAQARPHGRDHYPPNSQPLAEAQAIHNAREMSVQAIIDAVQAEALALQK